MDLTEFLNARLDEDEAAAGAGARRVGMPWRAEPQPGTPGGLVVDDLGLVGSTGGRYAAEHIARHDPARALREVEAGRKLMAEHASNDEFSDAYDSGLQFAVLLLAAVYSDHPDYDPAWAPAPTGRRGR
jgi:hypothetical protein